MGLTRISPDEAYRLMRDEGYVYLDVRTPEEFAQGHPARAYNIPIMVPAAHGMVEYADFITVARAAFEPETKIVVGCRSGNRSQAAAKRLLDAGFSHVVEQRAGWAGARDPFGRAGELGWQASGLPHAEEPEPGRDHETLAARARQ
ncbi:MAG: rhodanese-like domain-containing protein [Myxococcales bacterium]|jgi:rhodanese-related sulfurtransferase